MANINGQFNVNPATLPAVFDGRIWRLLDAGLPYWLVSTAQTSVFKEKATFDKMCLSCPLSFPPSLAQVLSSPTPPSLEFFKSLPHATWKSAGRGIWGIYVHVLKLAGRLPRVYIGSGTSRDGLGSRLRQYVPDQSGQQVPRSMQQAIEQGFEKTHTALLCWGSKPDPTLIPRARLRYLAVEGFFQMIFFACRPTEADPLWVTHVPWSRGSVSWQPLCSHIALNEVGKGDHNLSSADLLLIESNRKQRKNENKRRSTERNKQAVILQNKRTIAKARATGRFRCKICDKNFPSQFALDRHCGASPHKRNVKKLAAGIPIAPSVNTLRSSATRAKAKANRQWYCKICDHLSDSRGHLERHYKSQTHINVETDIRNAGGVPASGLHNLPPARGRNTNPRPFYCLTCNTSFLREDHLKGHFQTISHIERVAIADRALQDILDTYKSDDGSGDESSDGSGDESGGESGNESDIGSEDQLSLEADSDIEVDESLAPIPTQDLVPMGNRRTVSPSSRRADSDIRQFLIPSTSTQASSSNSKSNAVKRKSTAVQTRRRRNRPNLKGIPRIDSFFTPKVNGPDAPGTN